MPSADKSFYLGRVVAPDAGETTNETLLYDPDDLTTHAVVVGMTGSGKTGLCLDLLEEAALQNIPAIMIDPKGDITNALLHFPDLLPDDFAPWINVDDARRDGKTVEQAAADTAALWRNGLAGWDIDGTRVQALKDAAHFAIYTPGSDAGLPVSILSSLAAPGLDFESNREVIVERISGTVTAILGLIGLTDIDPVRSREHILLANIFENAWSKGQDLTLGELILQVQNPPFEKLGVFDVDLFFPEKDRFELSLLLNNILASPAFQSWIEGQPLNIGAMLYGPDGRPRHTIFYIAHLNDEERMFFVTLLYSAIETWMRAQSGTGSLRALVYFDEIFGYLPPTANPPSKEPMLRMLKQARAFGVGLVLATQNPVDVDYKALSNAGTWFIGKLATDQDKQRLLDGLESAMGTGLDRSTYDKLISSLGKRVFLLRNVHEKQPALFQTRWAMNYLAGPMTRTKIPELNALAGATAVAAASDPAPVRAQQAAAQPAAPSAPATTSAAAPEIGTATRPAVPGTVDVYFLPNNLTLSEAARVDGRPLSAEAVERGLLYRPVLLAQANVRVNNRKYGLDLERQWTALVPEPDERGSVRWEEYEHAPVDHRDLDRGAVPDARFGELSGALADGRTLTALKRDFQDWVYRNMEIVVRANEAFKLYAGPDVSADEFEAQCLEAARAEAEAEIEKVRDRYERKIEAVEKKLKREERELAEDEADYAQRKREEGVKHIETVLGLFGKRRRSLSGSMTKRRMTARAKAEVEESKEAIEDFKAELAALDDELDDALEEISARWEDKVDEVTEITVNPYKKDVVVDLFGVAWQPFYVVEADGRTRELPGFGAEG